MLTSHFEIAYCVSEYLEILSIFQAWVSAEGTQVHNFTFSPLQGSQEETLQV
jgi:hypothetical protein